MPKMLQVISQIILLIGLFCLAWTDFQTRLIKGRDLLLLSGLGIIIKMFILSFQKEQNFFEIWKQEFLIKIPLAMLIGVILFFIAKLTQEQVGIGDAFVFCVTGIFLDFVQNLVLLIGTFLLIGVFSLIWLLGKWKGRDDSVAMMPFTLAAYVLFVL